jgi:dTDP-4-dehydrorhamnose reductase
VTAGCDRWYGFAEAIVDIAVSGGLQRNAPKIQPISSSEYPLSAARPKNSRLVGERLRERFGIVLADWKLALVLCMQEEAVMDGL